MGHWIEMAISYLLHLDQHINQLTQALGAWSYIVIAVVIFAETGLVVTPFLPGDSFLFALGALSALLSSNLDMPLLCIIVSVAAILGGLSNYQIGKWAGKRVFEKKRRWLNQKHLESTIRFYEQHGGTAVLIARFMPIFRTFVPFVAGIARMSYPRYFLFNLVSAILWSTLFILAGYFFGNVPLVKNNFGLVMLAIIVVSLIPIVYKAIRVRQENSANAKTQKMHVI